MTTTVITITLGVITIIGVIIKCFRWAVKKIQDDYQSKLEDSQIKETLDLMVDEVKVNSDGTKALLRFRLRVLMTRAIDEGETTLLQFNDITKMFKAYKALGGNGTIEHLYEDYHDLPLKERKEK